ncbi:hypothetical protein HYS82_03845, partial [Candidatus Amesbacteria bacterium]|nr:hypothetical protein [Candidatus Amesbacteria bacterium]
MNDMRKYLIGAALAVIVGVAALGGAVGERMWGVVGRYLPNSAKYEVQSTKVTN